jgi:hypothetical protein
VLGPKKRMIHYHGTPISPRAQLERMAGRHFCVSFAAPQDLKTVLRIGQSVMFDNGAFSAFTRGAAFDVDGFYRWLEPIMGHPHWAVVPDVIDGTVEQQRAMTAAWPFRREFGIPVWHLGLPISYLLELCETWGRACLGSAGAYWQIGTPPWCGRMDEAFNALVQTFGKVPWIHGLRMLGQAEGPWPLASADSTNVAQNFKRDTGCAECKAAPIDATNPPSLWTERAIQMEIM